jgi:prepilin-type processing-associated H-X9-DG protein
MRQYSLLSNLLPFLEQQPLYNSINFDVGLQDTYLFDSPVCGSLANTTSFYQRLDTFLCPSSPQPGSHGDTGAVNYRVNTGSERWVTIVSSPNVGPLMCFAYASPSSVSDGFTNTVALSEKLIGTTVPSPFDARTAMFVAGLGVPFDLEASINDCGERASFGAKYYTTSGLTWAVGTLSQTCYNHTLTPNASVPDCILGLANPVSGLIAARSNHPDGVNAAFLDGAVRFIRQSVDRNIWRALGTAGGGEVVSATAY